MARALLDVAAPAEPQKQPDVAPDPPRVLACPCPRCGARMIVIEVFARGCEPRWRPTYWSPVGSRSKFRILKNRRAETRRGFRGLRYETPEIPRHKDGLVAWRVALAPVQALAIRGCDRAYPGNER
jgi:hypothetical protein